MEGQEAVDVVVALTPQLDTVGDVLLGLHQVRMDRLDNAAIAALPSSLGPGHLVDDDLPDVAVFDDLRHDVSPLLLCEGLNDLALGVLLRPPGHMVLAGRHVSRSWSKVKNANVRQGQLLFCIAPLHSPPSLNLMDVFGMN